MSNLWPSQILALKLNEYQRMFLMKSTTHPAVVRSPTLEMNTPAEQTLDRQNVQKMHVCFKFSYF